MTPRTIGIVVFDGYQLLDVAGPFEVFHGANRLLEIDRRRPEYRLVLIGDRSAASESGLSLGTINTVSPAHVDGPLDTLVVPGGDGVIAACQDRDLVDSVRRLAQSARRVVSVCSGAFVLAEAGLLDGRRVTTHWARAHQLAEKFPRLEVDMDPIFIRDDPIWTSAGVTAGMDLSLALVEDDLGGEIAQTLARWFVLYLRRPGGQSQFAVSTWSSTTDDLAIRAAQHHIAAHPESDLRVAVLASVAALSPRHFARRFTEELGETPAAYVQRRRFELARNLLESTELSTEEIARRTGLGSAETFRRVMSANLGVSPQSYRERFFFSVSKGPT